MGAITYCQLLIPLLRKAVVTNYGCIELVSAVDTFTKGLVYGFAFGVRVERKPDNVISIWTNGASCLLPAFSVLDLRYAKVRSQLPVSKTSHLRFVVVFRVLSKPNKMHQNSNILLVNSLFSSFLRSFSIISFGSINSISRTRV